MLDEKGKNEFHIVVSVPYSELRLFMGPRKKRKVRFTKLVFKSSDLLLSSLHKHVAWPRSLYSHVLAFRGDIPVLGFGPSA